NYFLLGVNLTKEQHENHYTSIMTGYMSNIEQYFAGKWNTLAVASWLDANPIIEDSAVSSFKDVFKSLLISTLAWQLTGYDAASVSELNQQILNAVHTQLNRTADNLGYDVQVIELSRIQNQVYVRLNVRGKEVIYSLFADPADVDLSVIASESLQVTSIISQLPLLGGEVVALSPVAYTNLLNRTNYKVLISELKPGDIVRSLLVNPLSSHILELYALNIVHNRKFSDFPEITDQVYKVLVSKGINEEKDAVREALRTFIEKSKYFGLIVEIDGIWKVNEHSLYAAQMAEQLYGSSEGDLIEFIAPPSSIPEIGDGKVEFLFADDSIPLDVLKKVFSLLSLQNGLGQYPLGGHEGVNYFAHFFRLSDDAIVLVINRGERPLQYQNVESLYRSLLGETTFQFEPQTAVRINLGQKIQNIQRVWFQRIGGENETIGETVKLNYSDPETLDYAIEYLNRIQKRHGFTITELNGSFQSEDETLNFIFETIFEHRRGVNRIRDQYHEFLHILDAYTYAASKGMTRTQKILSEKVVDILRGKIPRYAGLKDVLDGTNAISGITLDDETADLIYHIYLHHINYSPTNIDLNSIDPRILSRLIQKTYREDQPIPVGSAQERLLEGLRGGQYLAKTDFSPLETESDKDVVYEIFSDVDGMNKMFRKAGLLFSNTHRIRVSRSRLGGHISDYKVAVYDHQGSVTNIRLRVTANKFSAKLLIANVENMLGAGKEFREIIPEIYHYGQTQQSGFYFAEHIEGVLGDHILTHSEEYTEGQKLVRKYESVKIWMKYWNLKLFPIPDGFDREGVIERARISTPVSLEAVVFPSDKSQMPKLRAIGMQPPSEESFLDLLFSVNIGMGLVRKDQIRLLSSAVLSTFGYDRTIELLQQALSQAKDYESDHPSLAERPNDISTSKLVQMVLYLRSIRNMMKRDTVRRYIDIAYDGDTIRAFDDFTRVSFEQDIPLDELLGGKFAKWKSRLPTINEASSLLRQTRPSVLTISGGTGGNSLINTVKETMGGNMANIVTTFDAGGQSYIWQNILGPLVGYVPSKGDTTNLITAYLSDGMQDLLAKRLPADYEGDTLTPVINDLIMPTLNKYPELRNTPELLIDFIDTIKLVDEFLAEVNRYLPEGRKVNLKKASLKNLIDEALYYFVGAYDFDTRFFDAQKAEIAILLEHKLFNVDRGIVVPVSKDRGTLVAYLKQNVPQGQGALNQQEIQRMKEGLGEDTGLRMNRISEDGMTIYGEDFIGEGAKIITGLGSRIDYLSVVQHPDQPDSKPVIAPNAVDALNYPSLDLILFGPGSLYTSLLANFTVKEVVEGLVARGKKQEIKYPDGRVAVIESAKRVIILNPRYAAEDSGMLVREMMLTIERTAQAATGNPNLRFEDMFDAIVVNDPSQAPENVQDYIRNHQLDVIQPTQEDKEFFFNRGVEFYTYNLIDIQLRASRTPGFELTYDERLIYSPEKLSMVVRTLQTDSRLRKMEDLKNIGVGDGHHSPHDLLRVKEIIRKASLKGSPGAVKRINREKRLFIQRGVDYLVKKAHILERLIASEQDTIKRNQMNSDLSVMRQTIELIQSGDVPLFSIKPVDNSRGIFIDDITRYQFATYIEASEKNIQRGIYFSTGLIDLIEENMQVEKRALNEGDTVTAEKFAEIADSLAAEALFIQFSEWMIYQKESDAFRVAAVHDEMKKIAQNHISIEPDTTGGLLYSKISAVVKSELYSRYFTDMETMLNIPPELSRKSKITLINGKILKASRAQTIRNTFTDTLIGLPALLLQQVKQLYVFGPIVEDVVSDEEVLEIIRNAGYPTFYDLMVATAESISQSEENFRREITPQLLEKWLQQFQTLDTLFALLKYKIDLQKQTLTGDQRARYSNMKELISNMSNNIKPLNDLLTELQADPELLEILNVTRVIRISHMRDYVEELRTRTHHVDEKHEGYEEISEAVINRRAELNAMNIDNLSQAIEEDFIRNVEENLYALRRDVEQFFTLLSLLKPSFPRVKGPNYRELPEDATPAERIVAGAFAAIDTLRPYRELNDYGKAV
ncbi:YvcK family protein, partial [bacterium]|nr:YvcK family protein [bacterium]